MKGGGRDCLVRAGPPGADRVLIRGPSQMSPEVQRAWYPRRRIIKATKFEGRRRTIMSAAPAPVATAVQSPLNLMLTIQPGKNGTIVEYLTQNQAAINAALTKVGTVHFARFLMIPGTQYLFVITAYDGDFSAYIQAFTNHPGRRVQSAPLLCRPGSSAPGATECRCFRGLRKQVQPADRSLFGLPQLHRRADMGQRMRAAPITPRRM